MISCFKSKLITESFDEPTLYSPAELCNAEPCNSIKIITAFTDCDRISTHMIELKDRIKDGFISKNMSVEIILGMTKSSLSRKKHDDICRLIKYIQDSKDMPNISCRYIINGTEVHSKIYLWGKQSRNGTFYPRLAYCGSLNYTMNAYYKRRESICSCDCTDAYHYYQDLLADTVDCFNHSIIERINKNTEKIIEMKNEEPEVSENDYDFYDGMIPVDSLNVSLLKADGTDTGYGSGVNWGIRQNGTKRNMNQAYIPYNKSDKKEGFFPGKINKTDRNCPVFKVITKDFGSFYMRMAQEHEKAIECAENNSILGEWIRQRLCIQNYTFITKNMLVSYGKTYVTFRKYDDGTYLLDF